MNYEEEFDKWFEDCTIDAVYYAIKELDKYGWLDKIKEEVRKERKHGSKKK